MKSLAIGAGADNSLDQLENVKNLCIQVFIEVVGEGVKLSERLSFHPFFLALTGVEHVQDEVAFYFIKQAWEER